MHADTWQEAGTGIRHSPAGEDGYRFHQVWGRESEVIGLERKYGTRR